MHAETVELLVKKARLEPDVAVAFAEAMDMTLAQAPLVTIPVLAMLYYRLKDLL